MRGLTALVALAALVIAPLASARSEAPPARVDIVVGFKDEASAAKRANALSEAGVKVDERLPKLDAVVVTARAAAAAAVLRELRADRAVEYAGREKFAKAALVPNDPGYTASTWQYLQTALPTAWDVTTGTASAVIAVLDTGIDYAHPDLPTLAAGYDFINDDTNPVDDQGHGTWVTGTVGAKLSNGIDAAGVCPGCTVMPIKVLDNAGSGPHSDIAAGILWATDHGAKVINMSLGGPDSSQVLEDAVEYATERGVVILAAGGNDGTTDLSYPAAIDGVIGVAGTDSNNHIDVGSNRGSHLELAAPFCVQTTLMGGGFGQACGTSLATPMVAGVAGLMLSRNPALVGAQIESALTDTANGSLGLEVEYGLLDAHRAVLLAPLMPPVPVNTALPQITGTLTEGATLTVTPGSWTNTPTSYAYVWERCNASGVACAVDESITTATYQLLGRDAGARFRVTVTAANVGGNSLSATTAMTGVVSGNPQLPGSAVDVYATISPSTTAPAIGSTIVYKVVVGTRAGSAAASKVVLAFTMPTGLSQVESKPSRGPGCTTAGQTVTCDLGYFSPPAEAEVLVTATVSMAGTQTVLASLTTTPDDAKPADNMITSSVTVPGPLSPAPPTGQNQVLPSVTITGEAKVGTTLTADPGSGWAGKAPHVFSYQWVACSTVKGKLRCTSLAGETNSTLVVTRSHVGKRLHVVVVALGSDGIGELRESTLTDPVQS